MGFGKSFHVVEKVALKFEGTFTNLPNHPNVCHQRIQNVKVTGTVEEKDGKKWLTASKHELPAK